jgi:hypothetical protein
MLRCSAGLRAALPFNCPALNAIIHSAPCRWQLGRTWFDYDSIMCLGNNRLPQGLFGPNTGYLSQFAASLTALARVGSKYRQKMLEFFDLKFFPSPTHTLRLRRKRSMSGGANDLFIPVRHSAVCYFNYIIYLNISPFVLLHSAILIVIKICEGRRPAKNQIASLLHHKLIPLFAVSN